VLGCRLSAVGRVSAADEHGPAGPRCGRHGGNGDWFHRPHSDSDLCLAHHHELPGDERVAYNNVDALEALGAEAGNYEVQSKSKRSRAVAAKVTHGATCADGRAEAQEFPIECSLTKDDRAVYTLTGRCKLCDVEFFASGSVVSTTGLVMPFNTHARIQETMVLHAKDAHGLAGEWKAHRDLLARDPSARLIWTPVPGDERVAYNNVDALETLGVEAGNYEVQSKSKCSRAVAAK